MAELASILLDTLTPVFLLVGIGWVVGSRLGLDAQTAARLAYYVLGPAFVFDLLATADLEAGVVVRLVVVVTVSTLLVGAAGWTVARSSLQSISCSSRIRRRTTCSHSE